MSSSKAEFLQAAAKFKTEVVTLPGGLTATMREFSGIARDAYEQSMVRVVDGKREADLSNMRGNLVAASMIDDETGELMFTPDEAGALPASLLEPLFEAARRMNGLGGEQLDTAAKNSESGPSAASTSA